MAGNNSRLENKIKEKMTYLDDKINNINLINEESDKLINELLYKKQNYCTICSFVNDLYSHNPENEVNNILNSQDFLDEYVQDPELILNYLYSKL